MPSILLLRSSPHLGGIERQLLDHAQRLRQAGWEPHLLGFYRWPGEHPLVEAARVAGLSASTITDPHPLSPAPLRRLREALEQHRPALIHACDYRTDILVALARPACPWLAEAHGYTRENAAMALWNRLDAWALRRAAAVTAVSAAGETALAAAGVPAARLHVVANSRAILPDVPAPPPAELPAPGLHLLYAGRLAPEKGLDLLLQAWPDVIARHPAAQLWILGAPAARRSYRRALAPLLAQPGVHALGHVPDIRPWLLAAAAVIVPSRQETWGMTAFEALCAGVPLVAARVGGLPDLCRAATHALLVPPESPAALADGLRAALHPDFPRGPALGQQFCAQPAFDPAQRHARLLELYDSLI